MLPVRERPFNLDSAVEFQVPVERVDAVDFVDEVDANDIHSAGKGGLGLGRV